MRKQVIEKGDRIEYFHQKTAIYRGAAIIPGNTVIFNVLPCIIKLCFHSLYKTGIVKAKLLLTCLTSYSLVSRMTLTTFCLSI